MAINFLAIDFETATASRDSACAVGISLVEDGVIKFSASYLIQPPNNEYDDFNIGIHNITPKMTKDVGRFAEVMDAIINKYSGLPLVAHNASFDISVLRAGYEACGKNFPVSDYYCTLILSKVAIPKITSYKLPNVISACGDKINDHHNPKYDAEACAKVLIFIAKSIGANSLQDINSKYFIYPGKLSGNSYTPCTCKSNSRKTDKKSVTDFIVNINADSSGVFYDTDVAFTGAMASMSRSAAMQIVADRGGRPRSNVSKLTEFVVVGDVDYDSFSKGSPSRKLKIAMELVDAGNSIQIISEREFLNLSKKI